MKEYFQTNLLQTDDVSMLESKVDKHYARLENVRKGTYARINELNRKNAELERRLALLERNICEQSIGSTNFTESIRENNIEFVLTGT